MDTKVTEAAQVTEQNVEPEIIKPKRVIVDSGLALGLFSLLTMGLVFIFYFNTKEHITISQNQYEQFILREIVGLDAVEFKQQLWVNRKTGDEINGYLIFLEASNTGQILATQTPDGYSGKIELMVGIDANNQIIAVGVTKHSETPGLGDKIERGKSAWINQFNGKQLSKSNWDVKKDGGDFDSLSGATISSRAVVKVVEGLLQQLGDLDAIENIQEEVKEKL